MPLVSLGLEQLSITHQEEHQVKKKKENCKVWIFSCFRSNKNGKLIVKGSCGLAEKTEEHRTANAVSKSRVADRVLVPWPGVRPEPLRWESRAQNIGPQDTSRPHGISISKSSPRDLCLGTKTQLHSMANKLHSMANKL